MEDGLAIDEFIMLMNGGRVASVDRVGSSKVNNNGVDAYSTEGDGLIL